MILRPLPPPTASLAAATATAAPTAFNLLPIAFNNRGGATAAAAGAAAFDMGLAKTRLEGLAYSTVTTLLLNVALGLFLGTPKKLEAIPDNDVDRAKVVKLNNNIKFIFGLCMSLSVALGAYTTTIYALLTIYSKTALGMGLQEDYLKLFDKFTFYRVWGFRGFVGTILSYNIGWILSLILTYEGEVRWWMALPAMVIGLVGWFHFKSIMSLAGIIIYS